MYVNKTEFIAYINKNSILKNILYSKTANCGTIINISAEDVTKTTFFAFGVRLPQL